MVTLSPGRVTRQQGMSPIGPHGTTARMIKAGTTVMMGARMKMSLSAPPGISSSLKISLRPSAAGCSRPHGPARFGPTRVWNRAATLRSAKVI